MARSTQMVRDVKVLSNRSKIEIADLQKFVEDVKNNGIIKKIEGNHKKRELYFFYGKVCGKLKKWRKSNKNRVNSTKNIENMI